MRSKTIIWSLVVVLLAACSKLHKKAYYGKVDAESKSRYQEGYHSHEANRLIDFKNKRRTAIEKKSDKKQEKMADRLNEANKGKKVAGKRRKKLKFDFYM
ncbi:MAG TPA: hypothetical protein VL947_12425 [Cytophagales bacterium]|nr:hypothetical protein [Cytophagales bacterium]